MPPDFDQLPPPAAAALLLDLDGTLLDLAPTPDSVVVPPGLIPGDGTRTTHGAWDLGGLMDQLDAIYPDGNGVPPVPR